MPLTKFLEMYVGITLMLRYRYADGKALESICGKIMHWSQLRRVSKIFCHRLISFIHKRIRTNKRMRGHIFWITDAIARDLRFYLRFFCLFRKCTMHSVLYSPSITMTGSTDASNTGGGFLINGHYALYDFKDVANEFGVNHRRMSINYQEAHAVIMIVYNFRQILTGRRLLLYIDNKSVLYSLYKFWAGSVTLMEYCHEIALLLSEYRIDLRVEYIPSSLNGPADALSRSDLERFHNIVEEYNLIVDAGPTELEYYDSLRLLKSDVSLC